MLYPGDYISSAEEYLAGFGVYATKDSLNSSNIGDVDLDKKRHVANLKIKTKVVKMQGIGTVTIGIVARVSDKFAIVDLVPVDSENFHLVTRQSSAIIPVNKAKRSFVKDLRDCFRVGDIVRVKIDEITTDTVKLATNEKELGVIKAFCINCRKELKGKDRLFTCENCGTQQSRKTALDYDSGKVI